MALPHWGIGAIVERARRFPVVERFEVVSAKHVAVRRLTQSRLAFASQTTSTQSTRVRSLEGMVRSPLIAARSPLRELALQGTEPAHITSASVRPELEDKQARLPHAVVIAKPPDELRQCPRPRQVTETPIESSNRDNLLISDLNLSAKLGG
jgi:hypothetical protein